MAFYILHDSFIRPTLSHSVLKTRNENIFRESKNIVKTSTKTEKRKRDIVLKENVSINEDIHKNKQVNIKYAKEEFSQQDVENLTNFESDLSEEYGSASVSTEEFEEHGSENFLIFHFPLDESAVPPQSCKCHQLVIKHPEKLKIKPRFVRKIIQTGKTSEVIMMSKSGISLTYLQLLKHLLLVKQFYCSDNSNLLTHSSKKC